MSQCLDGNEKLTKFLTKLSVKDIIKRFLERFALKYDYAVSIYTYRVLLKKYYLTFEISM